MSEFTKATSVSGCEDEPRPGSEPEVVTKGSQSSEDASDVEVAVKKDTSTSGDSTAQQIQTSDFLFGTTLGEGAFARVVHAKSKISGVEFAVKIMEKAHIRKEDKVSRPKILFPLLSDAAALAVSFVAVCCQTNNVCF